MDYSWPGCPWDFPDRNTGVGCIPFPTQRLNSSLLHWQTGSWLMSHQRSPLLFRFQLKRRSWPIWSIKTFKTPSISVIRLSHFLINHVFTGVALFKNLFLGIGVSLTSRAVTVSGEQWRDSVTHTHHSPPSPHAIQAATWHWAELHVLYSMSPLVTHLIPSICTWQHQSP